MPVVNMPDGQSVSFPDDMPEEQIRGLIAEKFPNETSSLATGFDERFGEFAKPSDVGALRTGLEDRTLAMTRGPQLSPSAQLAIEATNVLPAASQETTPHVSAYGGKLVSTETFEDDAGNILYRDPQTGKVNPTNNATQVAIRDPSDGVVKVFDRSEATSESQAAGFARVLSAGLGAGAPTARPAVAAAGKIVPVASEIFSTAKPYYQAFKNEAGKIEIPAETAVGIADRLRRALDKANFIPKLADPVYSAAGILETGEPMTLDILQNVKRVIGKGFNSPDKNIRDAAGVASREITKIIGEISSTAAKNLKTADEIHSTAKSVQELQRKAAVADLRTGRAGYGGNAVNAMRQVLSPIVQRSVEGRVTGFQPAEIAAMREIVEGTTGTNVFRQIGAMSPSKGVMQIALGGATVGVTAAVGAAANKLAAIMTGAQIKHLNELVAKRSPSYSKSVEHAVQRWEKTQSEFSVKPTPAKLSAYVLASRALSSGLTKDGIQISSGDLLRAIQGPVKSSADEE